MSSKEARAEYRRLIQEELDRITIEPDKKGSLHILTEGEFGQVVRALNLMLEQKDMTYADLARAMGLEHNNLAPIFNGTRTFSADMAHGMMKALVESGASDILLRSFERDCAPFRCLAALDALVAQKGIEHIRQHPDEAREVTGWRGESVRNWLNNQTDP